MHLTIWGQNKNTINKFKENEEDKEFDKAEVNKVAKPANLVGRKF